MPLIAQELIKVLLNNYLTAALKLLFFFMTR